MSRVRRRIEPRRAPEERVLIVECGRRRVLCDDDAVFYVRSDSAKAVVLCTRVLTAARSRLFAPRLQGLSNLLVAERSPRLRVGETTRNHCGERQLLEDLVERALSSGSSMTRRSRSFGVVEAVSMESIVALLPGVEPVAKDLWSARKPSAKNWPISAGLDTDELGLVH
jgi:hypothetical protein